jgi:hypothetical protein
MWEVSSEVAAALYGALAGGVVAITSGVLVALGIVGARFIHHRLRERKKVRCVISGWETTIRETGSLSQAMCSFEVDLFNERPSPTGLRGLCVEVFQDGDQRAVGRLRASASDEELWVLNLPPRQWLHKSLYAFLEGEEAQKLKDLRWADFVGYFPNDKAFRQRIVERKDFVTARKKKHAIRKDYTPWWRRIFGR